MRKKKIKNGLIASEGLPIGLICLLGKQGAGKTSEAVAMLSNDYKFYGLSRFNKCKEFISELNKNGYNLHLPKNKVLYFSSEEMYLAPGIKTWRVDATRFAMPNLDFEVQYFPRYSVIYIPEYDNVVNCRDWESLSPYFVALAKYARHWNLTIIVDLQVFLQMDVSWRRLVMYTNYVTESYWQLFKKKYKEPNCPRPKFLWWKAKRVWRNYWIDNQLNNFAKDLSSMIGNQGIVKKMLKQSVTRTTKYFKDNVFNYYDSFSGIPYFLRRIKDYKYLEHVKSKLKPEFVEEYCITHPLTRPKEVAKRKKSD